MKLMLITAILSLVAALAVGGCRAEGEVGQLPNLPDQSPSATG